MHLLSPLFFIALLLFKVQAVNIVLSNDDGWAELNIRALFEGLMAANHSVVVSAPAYDNSGKGSKDKEPTVVKTPDEWHSIEKGFPPIGHNKSHPRLNYVNSYPATSMKHGIEELAPTFFDGKKPDLAIAGFNVGSNVGIANRVSGTLGAALMADSLGIPAIAFSGVDGTHIPWYTHPWPLYVHLYSEAAVKVVDVLTDNPQPWMDPGSIISVEFPSLEWQGTQVCRSVEDFKFVLTAEAWTGFRFVWNHGKDVKTCGHTTLPKEQDAIGKGPCVVAITVLNRSKDNASRDKQATVRENLKSILTCLED